MTIDIAHPAEDENLRKPYGHFEAIYDLDRDEFIEYLDDKIPDKMISQSFKLRVVGRDLHSADGKSWDSISLDTATGQCTSRDLVSNAFQQILQNQSEMLLDGEFKVLLYKEGRDRAILKFPITAKPQSISIGWESPPIVVSM